MKKYWLFIFALFLSYNLPAQTVAFVKDAKSWSEVLMKAKQLKKPIFVDVYTSWCLPCKKMDAEVFIEKQTVQFLNSNFISIKIDAEKEWGVKFAKENQVGAYPTYIYFDHAGKSIYRSMGYQEMKVFLNHSTNALKAFQNNKQYAKEASKLDSIYASKNYNSEFLYKYITTNEKIKIDRSVLLEEYLGKISPEEIATTKVLNLIYTNGKYNLLSTNSNLLKALLITYKSYPYKTGLINGPYGVIKAKLAEAIDSASLLKETDKIKKLIEMVANSLYKYPELRNREITYYEAIYFSKIMDKEHFLEKLNTYCTTYLIKADTSRTYMIDKEEFEAFSQYEKSKNPNLDQSQLLKVFHSESMQTIRQFSNLFLIYKTTNSFKDQQTTEILAKAAEKVIQLYNRNPVYVNPYFVNELNKKIQAN